MKKLSYKPSDCSRLVNKCNSYQLHVLNVINNPVKSIKQRCLLHKINLDNSLCPAEKEFEYVGSGVIRPQ